MDELTKKDHQNLDVFLGSILDYYKDGTVEKQLAINTLAHVMCKLNEGDLDEARRWFKQGRKLILQMPGYPDKSK
jgi:uncharacterized lipoprotein YehR (DUF1307 family)